jgi:hypothetical protein
MLARHVNAYTTEGHAWGVRQVPYYINPDNLYVSESSAVAAITSAAAAWRGIANVELVYAGYTTGSSLTNNGKNEVFFRNDSSGYIAETYWWYDGTGHLVDADIVFHESSRFYSANLGCNGDGFYIENTGAHEFGHALGCIHEHQNPNEHLMWNVKAVYAYFSGPPNYWSKADIDSNILEKYSPQGIDATLFDPDSIMLYQFPKSLFTEGDGTPNNTNLSKMDRQFIAQIYPH